MLFAAAYSAWRLAAAAPDLGEAFRNRIAFAFPGLFAIALAWLAARARALDRASRRAWGLLGAAWLAIEIGNLLRIAHGPGPAPPQAHASWLLCYPLVLAGILSFPRPARRRAETLQLWIGTASVVCGGAMLVVFLVLSPGAPAAPPDRSLLSLAYPLGDLVLLMGAALLALRRPREPARRAYALLVASLLVELAADLSWGALALSGLPPNGAFSDVGYMAAWALRGSAALAALRAAGAPHEVEAAGPLPSGLGFLPYVTALLGYGTLYFGVDPAGSWTQRFLVGGAAGLAALALLGQWLTARENARLEAERSARRSEARFRTLVQSSSDVIAVVDAEERLRYVSPSAARVLDLPGEGLEGRAFAEIVHPDDLLRAHVFLGHAAGGAGVSGPAEVRAGHQGRWVAMEALANNLLADPDIAGIVLTLRDVGERKALEDQLIHRALHDPLTGLANRALFADRLRQARQRCERAAERFAVVVVDLDGFKDINDDLGHEIGDQVLVETARRLREAVRATDTAARLGGDEFAVLVEGLGGEDAAREAAERLLAVTAAPLALPQREVRLTASLGVALGSADVADEEVLRHADLALYHAKESGKGKLALFAPGMRSEMLRRHRLEAELRESIREGRLHLVYQPVCSLRTGRVVGAEALVRWLHPTRGVVAPAEFIDLAESTGLIEPIGRWVIERACAQAAAWNRDGGRPFFVGVNLSVRQLHEPSIVDVVRAALAASGLGPELLVCELTETLLARDPLAAQARLTELKATGVRLALDDFGTGYSSLGRLRDLPIDVLKIDRVFTRDVATRQGRAVAGAIVDLAKAVGLLVVGEGVETGEQREALAMLRCDLAQGHHFARAMEAEELSARLARGVRPDVEAGRAG